MTELHDRIATAIWKRGQLTMDEANAAANAVIAELELRQEWLTEESSRLGVVALTEPEHPIATRTSSPWIAQQPAPRRLWDIFAEADE